MAEHRPRAHSPPRPKKKERPPPTPPALIRDHTRGIEFQRLGFLGEGGFARVYEARDETGRHLALKCVAKKSIQTKKAKTKLYAEIKLQQALDHPNIVGFKDVIEDEDNIYMSLELCESGSVMDILRRRKGFTEPEVRLWMVQLVGACMYMHGENVIHRDLKLGNIFLDGRLDLKIGDFGLAALIEKEGDRKKTICGTPNYIAPEVLFDTANGHSFEVDIWSIGVILYTLIIGKPPFQTKEVKAIYQRIKDNQYEFPDDKPISDEARELITGILTVDPRQRPTLQTVLDHPFFRAGPFPSSLPVSISDCAPDFQHLSPSQSAHNFARARARATQSRPVTNSRVRVSLGPSVAQQEKEFQRAVQPGSPISSLISSAKQPLLVSHDSKPSLLRKLNSTRAQPTDLVRRERDRIHASPMPAVGEEAAGEGEETGTNAEAEARAREELAEQKARIVAEMAGGSTLAVEPKEGSQRQEQPPGAALHGRPRPLARVENTSRPAGGSGVSSSRQGLKPPQDVEKPMGLPATRHLTGKERATLPAETRSTAHEVSMRPAGMFDAFSQNLAEALEAWDAGRLFPQHAGPPSHPPPPEVFIVSWLDYCNKYGMGYILSNGSSGVHFNDSTSIVLAPNRENFNYIASGSQRGVVSRRNYTLSACPEDLRSKVYLLKHFEGFMQERLTSQRPYCFVDEGRTRSLDFVQKYLRMKHVIVFKLSNDLLQFNFYDHVKLVLSSKGQVVSLITNDSVQTWSLAYLLSNPPAPEHDPKFYSSIIKKLRYLNVLLNTIRSSSESKAQPMQQPSLPSAQRSPLRE